MDIPEIIKPARQPAKEKAVDSQNPFAAIDRGAGGVERRRRPGLAYKN